MSHAEQTSTRVADMVAGRSCSGLSRSDERSAEKSDGYDRVANGVRPPYRNRAQQSLDAIFASDSFKNWQSRLAEQGKRDAEKHASRRSEPSNSYRMIDMQARRELGTYRGRP